jgi:chromate transporter
MSDAQQKPSLGALFYGFFTVGMCGFGGVLPWVRRMTVEQKRWLSAAEFTDMLGLYQFLPGGNVMNVTVALGARFHGIASAAGSGCGSGTRRAGRADLTFTAFDRPPGS